MNELLPFRTFGDPCVLCLDSNETDVYTFVEGKSKEKKVFKELKNTDIALWRSIFENVKNLEELASVMKKVFDIFCKYVGDSKKS
jgi:hypothetical protein